MTEQLSLFEEQPPEWLVAAMKRERQNFSRFDRVSLRRKCEIEFIDATPVSFQELKTRHVNITSVNGKYKLPEKIDRTKKIRLCRLAYVNKKRVREIVEAIRLAGKNINKFANSPSMNLGDAIDIGLITKKQYLSGEGRCVVKKRLDTTREQKKVK